MSPEEFVESLRPAIASEIMEFLPAGVEVLLGMVKSAYAAGQLDGRAEANAKAAAQIRELTNLV